MHRSVGLLWIIAALAATGANAAASDCTPGYYWDGWSCVTCVGGTYQDQPGQTSCNACPPGLNTDWGGISTWNVEHYGARGSASIYNCFHSGLPYSQNHCSGSVTCYYTSGTGSTAIYNGNHISWCDNFIFNSCDAGYYAPRTSSQFDGSIYGECVGNDYYSPAGDTSRYPCPAGTKSGGCGAGAASAGDCTPYKTLRNSHTSNAPIMRTVRTAPAGRNLCVDVEGTVYCGNLTETPIAGAIKLNVNGTILYVTDNATQ